MSKYENTERWKLDLVSIQRQIEELQNEAENIKNLAHDYGYVWSAGKQEFRLIQKRSDNNKRMLDHEYDALLAPDGDEG